MKGNQIPIDAFLSEFHGPLWEFEKKQIMIRIESSLMPIEADLKKYI
jgi:hypothetical protein